MQNFVLYTSSTLMTGLYIKGMQWFGGYNLRDDITFILVFGEDRIRERGGAEIAEQLAVRVRSDTCTDNLPSDVVNQRYNASWLDANSRKDASNPAFAYIRLKDSAKHYWVP